MAQYNFKYRIQSEPSPTQDGSGMVVFDVYGVKRLKGTQDPFEVVPGYHQTVLVSAFELQGVNNLPHGTAGEKTAKNLAAKELLAASLGIVPSTNIGLHTWSETGMSDFVERNEIAAAECAKFVDYVLHVINQTFPIDLNLS